MATANAQIGIERSAYYPEPVARRHRSAAAQSRLGDLFSASSALWSLGVVGGADRVRRRRHPARGSRAPRPAHDAAVARYRQTVLTAFQGVEDQLATARALAEQAELRRQASDAADQIEQQILNRYRAGQVGYTEVVTAQASALSARRALVQVAVEPPGDARSP